MGSVTEDGMIVFANRPCRTNCGCDEAWTLGELEKLREQSGKRWRRILEQDRRRRHAAYARIAKSQGLPMPCPGDRCLTTTPGGRLCHFCRRTEELAA